MPKADFKNGATNALRSKGLTNAGAERIANYITAQAQHESANFTSNNYMKNNNAIGMKNPSIRKSKFIVGVGSNGYAQYPNDAACAADLVEWLVYNKANISNFTSLRKYVDFVGSHHYFEDSRDRYYAGVNRFYGEVGQPSETIAGGVPQGGKAVIVVGAAALIIWSALGRA
ncbi:MAG: hypothetical protein JWQ09_1127 [Segetibacter sp.]|nr:hypothetical protein [Segetibacter sp.]